jgi:hypothetical protein
MTNDKITAELATIKPGLILMKNDTRVDPFKTLLETEYQLVYYDSAHRLYAHQSISKKPRIVTERDLTNMSSAPCFIQTTNRP